jgi:hypothetical protein
MSSSPPEGNGAKEDESEFSVADLGIPEYKPIADRPSRKFESWHRPRKQFVRRSQWASCLRDIYAGRDPADRVNYLGLPGTDLLDLRVFYESVCVPQQRVLRFLGFHNGINPGSPETLSLEVSLQQVKLRGLVHEGSKVLHDDINKIGTGDSVAFQEAKRTAPYDVINLDFCSGFASDEPQGLDSIYSTLNQIMAMQRRLEPWLLLITGLVGRDVFDQQAAHRLLQLFLAARECEGFSEACSVYFETRDLDLLDIDSCSDNDYFYAMAIGFCIWVFDRAQALAANRVSLRAAFYYQVNLDGPRPDMVSMAIRFRPYVVAAPDPAGLAAGESRPLNPCEAAVQFATKFANAVDVDERLKGHEGLRNELVNESAQLLLEAGYDEEEYRQWVAQFSS